MCNLQRCFWGNNTCNGDRKYLESDGSAYSGNMEMAIYNGYETRTCMNGDVYKGLSRMTRRIVRNKYTVHSEMYMIVSIMMAGIMIRGS